MLKITCLFNYAQLYSTDGAQIMRNALVYAVLTVKGESSQHAKEPLPEPVQPPSNGKVLPATISE